MLNIIFKIRLVLSIGVSPSQGSIESIYFQTYTQTTPNTYTNLY